MLIFLADGRLGNQLFQYSFLKSIQKDKELLLVSGFEEIDKYFEHDYFCNINKQDRYFRYFLYEIIQKVLIFIGRVHLISIVSVVNEDIGGLSRESTEYTTNYGLFRGMRFVKLGYFQSEKFMDREKIKSLKLKSKYLSKAKKFMEQVPKEAYPVFIHMRLLDYKNYLIKGERVILPTSYYKKCSEWFIANKVKPFFIILSDEPDTAQHEFKDLRQKIVSFEKDSGIDMGIMSMCKGAILSPSSYGWWGSYFMNNRDVVMAPQHWLGFNMGMDYYQGSIPSYAITQEVS
jgi:hypothetical protein